MRTQGHSHGQGKYTMAKALINVLRQVPELKGNTLLGALQIAHAASHDGSATISYSYLAKKIHCCRRTAFRVVERLCKLQIIQKSVTWISAARCEWNKYRFLIHWQRPRDTAQMSLDDSFFSPRNDKVAAILPYPEEREKKLSLGDEIKSQELALKVLTPGSMFYQSTQTEIARLRGLQLRGAL
jgi:hypothetical protein